MVQIVLDIDDGLLEDLKSQALKDKSNFLDLIQKYIKQGLDNMSTVLINDDVMEKVNLKANFPIKLLKKLLMRFYGIN